MSACDLSTHEPAEANAVKATTRRGLLRTAGLVTVGAAAGLTSTAVGAMPASAAGGLDDLTDVDLTGAVLGEALVLGPSSTWIAAEVVPPSALYALAPVLAADTVGGFNLAPSGLPVVDSVSIPDGGRSF